MQSAPNDSRPRENEHSANGRPVKHAFKAEADKLKAAAPDLSSAGRRSTTYGGIGGGERTDPYAGARGPPAPSVTSTHSSPIKVNVSPKKNYEKPSAKSYVGTEDAHSFRPYDTPKRPPKPPSHASSAFTQSSYAPSQSTSRTTPPPSQRGPYSTNDPDKIQIRAVFLFNDLFPKPVAQLVSGIGHVTDGLVLKIQSEGLFIDDDVRNVPQREWDIKAWTLKLVEVSFSSTASAAMNILTESHRLARRTANTYSVPVSATLMARNMSSSSMRRKAGKWQRDCSVCGRAARLVVWVMALFRRARSRGY